MKQISNVLYIDTRDNKKIIVSLETKKRNYIEQSKANIQKSQATLPLILKVLKKAKAGVDDIDEIRIERGVGSFTGLRVGASIVNALSFALGIKINQKKLGTLHVPKY